MAQDIETARSLLRWFANVADQISGLQKPGADIMNALHNVKREARRLLNAPEMTITADMVKELRERTGEALPSCRDALFDAGGDMDKAAELLRSKGLPGFREYPVSPRLNPDGSGYICDVCKKNWKSGENPECLKCAMAFPGVPSAEAFRMTGYTENAAKYPLSKAAVRRKAEANGVDPETVPDTWHFAPNAYMQDYWEGRRAI